MVPGINGGVVARVEVAIDGQPPQAVNTQAAGAQVFAHFKVDLSALAAGPHTLTATGVSPGVSPSQTATVAFTVDRSLPAPVNRVERAADPEPFTSFDAGAAAASRSEINARIVPGALGAPLDVQHALVVLSLGGEAVSIQPSQWHCDTNGCSLNAASSSFKQVSLRPDNGSWVLHLGSVSVPADPRLFLRIGNQLGGVDLATGELLASARVELDSNARKSKIIGAAGGSLDAVDSHQIAIHLDITAPCSRRRRTRAARPTSTSPWPCSSARRAGKPAWLRWTRPWPRTSRARSPTRGRTKLRASP